MKIRARRGMDRGAPRVNLGTLDRDFWLLACIDRANRLTETAISQTRRGLKFYHRCTP